MGGAFSNLRLLSNSPTPCRPDSLQAFFSNDPAGCRLQERPVVGLRVPYGSSLYEQTSGSVNWPVTMDAQLLYLYYIYTKRNKKRKGTRGKDHILNIKRPIEGAFVLLYNRLRSDNKKFFSYFLMSISSFDELLIRLKPCLEKNENPCRNTISSTERLAVTLR